MRTTQNGINVIKKYEGCKLEAYLCPANIPTIGYGNTFYEDGTKVKVGDKITLNRAEELLLMIVRKFENDLNGVLRSQVNENQYDALISFTYNLGIGNLKKSTLLSLVNISPNDIQIGLEFLKWNKAGGKVLPGLTRRRESEKELYFKK